MGLQTQHHTSSDKVKMTFECTMDERAYIKMLAAKAHLNLSEFLLSYVRSDFPKTAAKKPNKKTIAAMKELEEGKGIRSTSIDQFWEDMGIDPNV